MMVFLGSFCGTAQPVATTNDSRDEQIFMPYELAWWSDPTRRFSIQDVSQRDFADSFAVHSTYHNRDFIVGADYWIKLPVRHSASSQKVWLLELYDQTIDTVDVFVPDLSGGYSVHHWGDGVPFESRLLRHKNFEWILQVHQDTVLNYYFRIRSHEFADMRIALRSVNRFVGYALNEYFLFGTFYGMILIISLYNFLVYLAVRERKFVYYIFYILSVAVYALSLDGVGFQYLWPNQPILNELSSGLLLYMVILWALFFGRRFLVLHANAPDLDRQFRWMIIARTTWLGVCLLRPEWFAYRVIEILPLSLAFYAGIVVFRNGYRPARFFVIAYGVLFSGFLVRGLVTFNVLPFTIGTHYSLHFGFVMEMVFLTLALGDRIRILKDNRDAALRKIIQQHEEYIQLQNRVTRELEDKVRERTLQIDQKNAALEESNHRLIRQSEEISKINSLLDLDNWKLKNRVREVLHEMLIDQTMTYAEFKVLYPDTLTCHRFLESLKWKNGYRCRKCQNERYFEGTPKFARRCTRCGYNESVTAFTIFQGTKFPLDKAFYVAYMGVLDRTPHTLEQLAKELEINVNTVWAFRLKVMNARKLLKQAGHHVTASRWEEVILAPEPLKGRTRSNAADPVGMGDNEGAQ